MSFVALILVFFGSLFSLGWNILAKKASDQLAFLWLAIAPTSLIGACYIFPKLLDGEVNTTAMNCIFLSSVIHVFYFWSLAHALKKAELSVVFPYSRGFGALLAILGSLIILGERPSFLGWVGVLLALFVFCMEPFFKSTRSHKTTLRGFFFTLATGLAIALYHLIDKIAVSNTTPETYLAGLLAGTALILGFPMLYRGRAVKELKASWAQSLFGGLLLCGSFAVILFALDLAPLIYVVPARGMGIILSGVAGIIFFKEKIGFSRWCMIGLVTVAVVCISLGK